MSLSQRVAFVTGASQGIGRACALRLAKEGATVVISGRNKDKLDTAVREIGGDAFAFQADITSLDAMNEFARSVGERFGPVGVLFANAGVAGKTPLGAGASAAFDGIIQTNLSGAFYTVSAFSSHLAERASVVLCGSVHARLGEAGFAAYSGWYGDFPMSRAPRPL